MAKRKLIYDASIIVNAYVNGDIYKTGLYRVSVEILNELLKRDKFDIYLFDVFFRERELEQSTKELFKGVKIIETDSLWYKSIAYPLFNVRDYFRKKEKNTQYPIPKTVYKFLKNIFNLFARSIKYLYKKKYTFTKTNFNENDYYLSTFYPLPKKIDFIKPLKKSIIIHDLISLIHPEYFLNEHNKILMQEIIESIDDNDKVICVSESTKQDFIKFKPKINKENVKVSYLGSASVFSPESSEKAKELIYKKITISLEEEYFLSVCTLEPRKNLTALLKAYELLIKETDTVVPKLVLSGTYGWKSENLLLKIEELNRLYPNSVILTGFVTDYELKLLYSFAKTFVYPSLYEGFGLPVLEAMKCGAPVITSNNSSLKEIGNNTAVLVDAEDYTSIYKAMQSAIGNDNLEKESQKSIENASNYTWQKTVDRVISIMN